MIDRDEEDNLSFVQSTIWYIYDPKILDQFPNYIYADSAIHSKLIPHI